jgi:hypothetical protein
MQEERVKASQRSALVLCLADRSSYALLDVCVQRTKNAMESEDIMRVNIFGVHLRT